MSKIVSFSLWGNKDLYSKGAVENAKTVPKMLGSTWKCRFYIDSQFQNKDIVNQIAETGAEIIYKDLDPNHPYLGMTWRFLPACDPSVSIMLSRDADSRITKREAEAIWTWESSQCNFHVIRDNPAHATTILGGTWGCKGGFSRMAEFIEKFKGSHGFKKHGDDQIFLSNMVWEHVRPTTMAHDAYFGDLFGKQKEIRHMNPPKMSSGYVGMVVAI